MGGWGAKDGVLILQRPSLELLMEDLEQGSGVGQEMGAASASKVDDVKDPEKRRTWPCSHPRFTKVDRMKFRDRIEVLKECRRCGHNRVFVTYRDFNTKNCYVRQRVYDVPRRYDNIPEITE